MQGGEEFAVIGKGAKGTALAVLPFALRNALVNGAAPQPALVFPAQRVYPLDGSFPELRMVAILPGAGGGIEGLELPAPE